MGRTKSIFEHDLVSKHSVLAEKDVRAVLSRYNITKDKLPRMLVTDPACVEIGAKVGDVVKITRKSATAGETEYFRVVIKG